MYPAYFILLSTPLAYADVFFYDRSGINGVHLECLSQNGTHDDILANAIEPNLDSSFIRTALSFTYTGDDDLTCGNGTALDIETACIEQGGQPTCGSGAREGSATTTRFLTTTVSSTTIAGARATGNSAAGRPVDDGNEGEEDSGDDDDTSAAAASSSTTETSTTPTRSPTRGRRVSSTASPTPNAESPSSSNIEDDLFSDKRRSLHRATRRATASTTSYYCKPDLAQSCDDTKPADSQGTCPNGYENIAVNTTTSSDPNNESEDEATALCTKPCTPSMIQECRGVQCSALLLYCSKNPSNPGMCGAAIVKCGNPVPMSKDICGAGLLTGQIPKPKGSGEEDGNVKQGSGKVPVCKDCVAYDEGKCALNGTAFAMYTKNLTAGEWDTRFLDG